MTRSDRPGGRSRLRPPSAGGDVAALLVELGVRHERRGGDAWACCPNHREQTASWHVRLDGARRGLFFCFGCKWGGGLVDLVVRLRGGSRREVAMWLRERGLLGDAEPESLLPPGEAWKGGGSVRQRLPADVRPLAPDDAAAWEYLRGRGVADEVSVAWRVHWWERARRVVVPIAAGGQLVDWVARDVTGAARLRVLSSSRRHLGCGGEVSTGRCSRCSALPPPEEVWSGKGLALAGADLLRAGLPRVAVAEGVFDAMRLWSAGVPAVAVCTNRLTEQQLDRLVALSPGVVEVWPDGDAGGDQLVASAASLRAAGLVVVVRRCPPGRDPADLSDDEVRELSAAGGDRLRSYTVRLEVVDDGRK